MSEWLDVSDLKTMLRALADVARLNIVHHLAGQGEVNVTEICLSLNISQPLVSWHLRRLRRAGIVRTRRFVRQVYGALDLPRFQRGQQELASLVTTGQAPEAANLDLRGERVQS